MSKRRFLIRNDTENENGHRINIRVSDCSVAFDRKREPSNVQWPMRMAFGWFEWKMVGDRADDVYNVCNR